MPLIEGVGDEVVQFVGVVVVLAVGALAWCSTNARPDRYRTVLVMRSRAHHPVTVSIRTRPSLIAPSMQASSSTQSTSGGDPPTVAAAAPEGSEEPRENARVIPLQEMDSIVDADMAMLDNNRLHFYRRVDVDGLSHYPAPASAAQSAPAAAAGESAAEGEPAGHAQIREMDSIVSAMEADVSSTCDWYTPEPNSTSSDTKAVKNKECSKKNSESTPTVSDASNEGSSTEAAADQGSSGEGNARKILIRLKYLNDTLKEVEGSLDELLKDFKSRHFSAELSAERRVRLIFQGRALLDDAASLRALGLHHRAVVHCLVLPGRPTHQSRGPSEEAPQNATHELVTEGAPPERAWDLENILMTLVSVALTVVWFFRCEYSNMFTASASVALFGLTVFYSVAIFGLYLSDTFHFDRQPRPPPPVPNH